jgi:hypothetical protein
MACTSFPGFAGDGRPQSKQNETAGAAGRTRVTAHSTSVTASQQDLHVIGSRSEKRLVGMTGEGRAESIVADELDRASLALLEFLEQRVPKPNVIGATPASRTATRELVAVSNEATSFFRIWARQGDKGAGRASDFKHSLDVAVRDALLDVLDVFVAVG